MNGKRISAAMLILVFLCAAAAQAADRTGFDKLVVDMDAARLVEANVFAPKTWEKAIEAFEKARYDIQQNKKQKNLDKHVAEAAEYTANAVKATEVGKLSLQEYLAPRDKAKSAGAPALVPLLYQAAEEQFVKATKKVESGDVKGALKEADKAAPYFDKAEMEAIRADILGAADRLIAKAQADDAAKYGLSTLDKSTAARSRANTILTSDRYNRAESVEEAAKAEYEARHASNIALSVRSLKRNDQAWEKLMLVYEIQMNRTGEAFDYAHLSFDDGPQAAADQLIQEITGLQGENRRLKADLAAVSGILRGLLVHVDATSDSDTPVALARATDTAVKTMTLQMAAGKADLSALAERQEQVEDALAVRLEREQKFKKAKAMLNPSEGDVLFNASNDIVLRLHGLSFGVGNSEIQDAHIDLLNKVQAIVEMFPESHLVIEGHTDLTGDPTANVALSERRAYSVMQHLRGSMLLSMDRVRAMGYGADRPVSSNKTADGRAKNRRIDIIVMQ